MLPAFATPLVTCVQLLAALWLYVRRLPRRRSSWGRLALSVGASFAVTVAFTLLSATASLSATNAGASSYGLLIATFFAVTLGLSALVWWCFDISVWSAAFVGIASYSTQNLATTLLGLLTVASGGTTNSFIAMGTTSLVPTELALDEFALVIATTLFTYVVCYICFARRITERWAEQSSDWKFVLVYAAVLVFNIAFDITLKSVITLDMSVGQRVILVLTKLLMGAFLLFSCFNVLLTVRLEENARQYEQTLEMRARQYRFSQDRLRAINRRLHDMRHQIGRIMSARDLDSEVLGEVVREVRLYDAEVKTGNEVLDCVISEKGLECAQAGISFTHVIDGAALESLPTVETYALLSGLLENAIDASLLVPEDEARSISLGVRRQAGMVLVQIDNYVSGSASTATSAKTTRNIVRSQGGTIRSYEKDGISHTTVLIPAPRD